MAPAVLRCALVVVALLAEAWLLLGLRMVELEAQGREVRSEAQRGRVTADEVRHGQDLLHRARRLNADSGPLYEESLLLLNAGRRREAAAAARRLVEEEPDNLDGWILVYLIPRGRQLGEEALRRVRALSPLAAESVVNRPPIVALP